MVDTEVDVWVDRWDGCRRCSRIGRCAIVGDFWEREYSRRPGGEVKDE